MLEPVIGVYGLRTFRLSADLRLVPVAWRTAEWADGRCIATCRSVFARGLASGRLAHDTPDRGCTCGIHAVRSLGFLRAQYSTARDLVAVVALEGTVVEGEYGYRAQAAKVVAIAVRPGLLTVDETAELISHLPAGTRLFDEAVDMVPLWPGLSLDRPARQGRRFAVAKSTPAVVLAPLLAAAAVMLLPGWFKPAASIALWPGTPVLAGLAIIAIMAAIVVFLARWRSRLALTAPALVLPATALLVAVWTLTTIRSMMIPSETNGALSNALEMLLGCWVVGQIVLGVKRPAAVVITPNAVRTRVRTRIPWSTTDHLSKGSRRRPRG